MSNAWILRSSLFGLFFILLGSKALLVREAASAVPYWDQWDAEAANLLIPWLRGELSFADLFTAHNEHRIFFTRLLVLALVEANGQWDPLLEMFVNLSLSALFYVLLLKILWDRIPGRVSAVLLTFAVVTVGVLPFGWENLVSGFQSQFYLMLLFALMAFYWTICASFNSPKFYLGLLLLPCSLLTMASGLLVSATLLVTCVFVLAFEGMAFRRLDQRYLVLIFAASFTCLLGFLIHVSVPYHDFLRPDSFKDFFQLTASSLSWPWIDFEHPALLTMLPMFILVSIILASKQSVDRSVLFVLVFALWVGAQALSIGYARGGGADAPASRYMDILGLLPVLSLAAVILVRKYLDKAKGKHWLPVLVVALVLNYIAGWIDLYSNHTIKGVMERAEQLQVMQTSVRSYVLTGKKAYLDGSLIPYPDSRRLGEILDDSLLQAVLPIEIGKSIELVPLISDGFEENGFYPGMPKPLSTAYGSYNAQGDANLGRIETEWLEVESGWLSLAVIGNTDSSGNRLWIETDEGDRLPIRSRGYVDRWKTLTVGPINKFRVVGVDNSQDYWFAVSHVQRIGYWGHLAREGIQKADQFIYLGLIVLLVGVFFPWIKNEFRYEEGAS